MKIKPHLPFFILIVIFSFNIFLRFYELETKNIFSYDQTINAWAAKNIIIDHNFPLIGPSIKQNSGIYLGPFYYYFSSFFYLLTRLDPVASGIIAGVTSIFSFWVIFIATRKLFSTNVALIAVFLNTFSINSIQFERVQWNANFIPAFSLLIFLSLYKIITGEIRYLILLAISLGFFFHVHFTVIFFPLIILLVLPFFPRTKEFFKQLIISLPLFLAFLIPSFLFYFSNSDYYFYNAASYGNYYFLGLHLKRVLQLASDAFIQLELFSISPILKNIKFIIIPLFFATFFLKSVSKEKIILSYLVFLWFIIPWIVMSTYGGEIADYYFSANRFIGIMILSYVFSTLFLSNNFLKVLVILFFSYYLFYNLSNFLTFKTWNNSLLEKREKVLKAISKGKKMEFAEGVPEAYLYYYYNCSFCIGKNNLYIKISFIDNL